MSDLEKQINFWKNSAENDWKTARILFDSKRYDACLFFCHLTLEKCFKGLVTEKTKKAVPYTHDLEKLAIVTGLKFSDDQLDDLRIITKFNISARYENIKFDFYKICTADYAKDYLNVSHKLFLWLKKQYRKK
jgi:HEPN domain-containing protein